LCAVFWLALLLVKVIFDLQILTQQENLVIVVQSANLRYAVSVCVCVLLGPLRGLAEMAGTASGASTPDLSRP
jgi:hypothetical protein